MRWSSTRLLPVVCTIAVATGLCLIGCDRIPGRPASGPQVARPEEILDFAVLYKSNCSACHGQDGRNAATIGLANPVYLSVIGEATLHEITAKGVPGKLMPAFARSAGGTLTDQQVSVLAHGIIQNWSKPTTAPGQSLPPYRASLPGDTAHGEQAFGVFCASCHGVNGEGKSATINGKTVKVGSIVDESYLALISDQGIRSFILAGAPDEAMPDWRSDGPLPMTDQQITDVVAWMASKRTANPGQPYAVHP